MFRKRHSYSCVMCNCACASGSWGCVSIIQTLSGHLGSVPSPHFQAPLRPAGIRRRTESWMDGWTDRRMDGQTDGRMDRLKGGRSNWMRLNSVKMEIVPSMAVWAGNHALNWPCNCHSSPHLLPRPPRSPRHMWRPEAEQTTRSPLGNTCDVNGALLHEPVMKPIHKHSGRLVCRLVDRQKDKETETAA